MNDNILYFIGFVAANIVFLFLFPYNIGLNAANALRVPFKYINVKKYLFKLDRFLISGISCLIFGIILFHFDQGGLAIIVGSFLSAAFVVQDYIRIFRGNTIIK